MKTILVDAVNVLVIKGVGIFAALYKMLEKYPQRKIVLTNADDEQLKSFGLDNLPYEVFTLKHQPDKTDPKYYKLMLKHFNLKASEVIYFEHNLTAVENARLLGIATYYYDKDQQDVESLEKFIQANL